MPKYLILDGNSVANRAFYAIRLLNAPDGSYTNAIFGFSAILQKLIEDIVPDGLYCAFDLKAPTFRHKMYSEYKATRKGMPDELFSQMAPIKEMVKLFGGRILELAGFEADDIIGTFSRTCERSGCECVIATGDRDALQLITDKTEVIMPKLAAGKSDNVRFSPDVFREEYGFDPPLLVDYKAICGDKSDNIPGVRGIGEKGAMNLIMAYGNLDSVYDHVDDIPAKLAEKLKSDKENALLSRRLAEIDVNVPVQIELSPSQRDDKGLYEFFFARSMKSTITRLKLSPLKASMNVEVAAEGSQFSFDSPEITQNTTSVKAADRDIVAAAKNEAAKKGYFVFLHDAGDVLFAENDSVYRALSSEFSETFGSADIEKDTVFYKEFIVKTGITMKNVVDLSLAAFLADSTVTKPDAVYIARKYGDASVYLSEQALFYLRAARDKLLSLIESSEMSKLFYNVEMPLCEVLADMEREGVRLDVSALNTFGAVLGGRITQLEDEIYSLCGGSFNINSPKQLGDVLFERLGLPKIRKNSTDHAVLEKLARYHPAVTKIIEYRELSKLKGTYCDGIPKFLQPDGRIHAVFNQTATVTGRLSCTDPNLQNIPVRTELGSELRKMFVPEEGCVFVDSDYSQIELRILAHMAGDANMTEAFRKGEDIHAATASQIFDVPIDQVTATQRVRAKAVNFGIAYGMGGFSLADDIGVTTREANRYIASYFEKFSGVKEYMEKTIADAKKNGFVMTIMNRRRYIPELFSSSAPQRAFGERAARNTPIQGSAADIMKAAMVNIYKMLKESGLSSKIVLQIHDELIIEAPQQEAEQAADILKKGMENVIELTVPLVSDAKTGRSWFEVKG